MSTGRPREASALPAVELEHVHKWYGSIHAVRGISLRILQNEFFSLLGPSGCGKTTVLRMISGFETPTEGTVYLKGEVANAIPPYRRDTNLIFQHLALFPHLDVYDNIAFGLRLRRLPRPEIARKVRAALELVDLVGYDTRRIHQLSGGQKQRIAIARALVNEPAVLLLDEPLGALDLRLRIQMQVELKEIQHRVGTTFVYVTHDQTEAMTMSDRIAVMNHGFVEQIGTSRDVYERPRTRFVATFLGDSNLLEAQVESSNADQTVLRAGAARLIGPADAGATPGSSVTLCVRPERLRFAGAGTASGGDDGNRLDARVRDAIFKGAVIEYRLVTESGARLILQAHADAARPVEPGAAVTVTWRKEDGVLLTE